MYKIYFKVMFNHLIRLYISVLVCVLVGQNLIAPLPLTVKVNGDCKNYTAHAQSIFQCKKKDHRGTELPPPPYIISHHSELIGCKYVCREKCGV